MRKYIQSMGRSGIALALMAASAFAQGGLVKGVQGQVNGAQQAAGGVANGARQGAGNAVQQAPQVPQQVPRAVQQAPQIPQQAPRAIQQAPRAIPQAPRAVQQAPNTIPKTTPNINPADIEPKSAVPNVPKPVAPLNPLKTNPADPQVRQTLPNANHTLNGAQRNLPNEVRTYKVPNDAVNTVNRNLPNARVNSAHTLGGTQINVGPRQINIGNNGYRPSYSRYPRYYAGYWAGNYGPGWGYGGGWGNGYYGPSGYAYRPLGWGLGAWGLGGLAYNSGYVGYYNPYYTSGGYTGFNYSQPIPTVYDNSSTAAVGNNSTDSVLQAAVAAFQQNNYDQALDIVNQGITQSPNDAVLHEFRALVLFAKGDYQQAAATIHSVLAVGPGWNWETVRNIYPSVAIYTTQLRALETFTKQNAQDSAARFLLAYHYMVGGHQDAAARQLNEVVRLTPDDRTASDLLQMLSPPTPQQGIGSATASTTLQPSAPVNNVPNAVPNNNANVNNPVPQPPVPADRQPQGVAAGRQPQADSKIDPAMLVGNWNASRDDGSQFNLTLNQDGTFTWKFNQKNNEQSFDGKYTLEGNVLALQRKDGGSLVATVTPDGDHKFNFKLLGAPPSDQGLNFATANQ